MIIIITKIKTLPIWQIYSWAEDNSPQSNTSSPEIMPDSLVKPEETRTVARKIQKQLMRESFPHFWST